MSGSHTATITRYSVVFGPDESERQVYADRGDGSFLSTIAEVDATREFMRLSALGVRCGFWVNGTLTAGEDFAEPGEPEAVPVVHKTRTTRPSGRETGAFHDRRGWLRDQSSSAYCTCNWTQAWDNRDLARVAAREHRRNPEGSRA